MNRDAETQLLTEARQVVERALAAGWARKPSAGLSERMVKAVKQKAAWERWAERKQLPPTE